MMNITRSMSRRKGADEAGMGLVEVLVAISLITIVATASATLVLNGIAASATIERRQVAITIASGTMESVSAQSVATASATGVSALYTGRTSAAVHSVWLSNTSASGVSQTTEAYDPTALAAATPSIPISSTVTQAGTDYAVQTLIGTCLQPTSGGDCKVATPGLSTTLIRAIVIVKWTAGDACSAGCSYVASTLIDPHQDLEWVTHG